MSVVNLTQQQKELVENAALSNDFKTFDVVANVGSIKGDNYLGIIHAVKVTEKNKQDKVLHFILKSAHTNENFRKLAPIHQTFIREALLYSTIIPRLLKHQDEKVISDPFTGVAKYYGSNLTECHESILMQNLKEDGYQLWDRMKPMDDEHITLVFSEYARLHAASFALKHQHPEEFKELTKDIELNIFEDNSSANTEEKFERFIKFYFDSGLKAVEDSPKALAALHKLRSNIAKLFEAAKTKGKDTFVVLHGDCWCNNMLFKYEESQINPTKVCFIDWQLSKLGSPVNDLAYFFCVCGSKEVFSNITRYLHVYHQVLLQNLKEFGCDPEEIFSFEVLVKEWKRQSWYGVFLAMMVIKLMLSASEEAPNLSEAKESNTFLDSMADFNMLKSSEVKSRMCDLVEFMSDNHYI